VTAKAKYIDRGILQQSNVSGQHQVAGLSKRHILNLHAALITKSPLGLKTDNPFVCRTHKKIALKMHENRVKSSMSASIKMHATDRKLELFHSKSINSLCNVALVQY